MKQGFNRFSKWFMMFMVVIVTTLSTTRPVSAHAALLRSEPGENAILSAPPTEVRLWFTEPISPQFSGAQLLDTEGTRLEIHLATDETQNNLLIIGLPPIEDGVYSVLWRVHSTADGHFTQGLFVFGVGAGANVSAAASPAPVTPIAWPEVALRWLNFTFLLGLIGAAAINFFVLKPAHSPEPLASILYQTQRRIWHWGWWWCVAGLIVGLLWLAWQTTQLKSSLPEGTALLIITGAWLSSRLGVLWGVRQLALLVLILALSRQRQPQPLLLWGLLLLLLFSQSLTSHAAALPNQLPLALLVDILHLLAAGVWVGGLLALAIGLLPLLRHHRPQFKAVIKAGWAPFGRLALLAVLLLIATGLYSTGRQVVSLDALISTLYGQALLVKVGLMLVVGLVGFTNALLLHPALATFVARWLRRPPGWTPLTLAHLPRLVVAEVLLGLVLLGVVGFITSAPTAQGAEFLPPPTIPTALSQTVDDMVINLAIKPNLPGQNVLDIRAVSSRRPPPAEIVRVLVRLQYQDQDFGLVTMETTAMEPGRYLLGGDALNLSGAWQIAVVVRRLGLEDSVATFDWVVGDGRPVRPVLVSNRAWQPLLTVAAAFVLLLLVVIGLMGRGRGLFTTPPAQTQPLSTTD
ncbi:MAG: copper resistance protein CopC/CopD [Chloroflexi bacterium]|nr:copper resistance protein CopC/CopD [Chloroflexota bacterium]MBP8057791.1 copper resistance protein CopC/CopD [Chloroflexota bacterium]